MKKSISHDSKTYAIGESLKYFLANAGVQEHKQAELLRKTLGISTTHAYRKMRDSSPWEVSQLQIILKEVGSSLTEFFEFYEERLGEKSEAIIEVQKEKSKCTIYFTSDNDTIDREFSALLVNDEWLVHRTLDMQQNEIYMGAKRNIGMIQIKPEILDLKKYSIALLDDDIAITDSLKEVLSDDAYHIDTFSSISTLREKIKKYPYDAYVLDWIVENNSVFESIKMIRDTTKPDALIIALTGQLGGKVDKEITDSINDYDVLGPYEKPVRLNVIKTVINKYFSR